jgi:hypothetical protein
MPIGDPPPRHHPAEPLSRSALRVWDYFAMKKRRTWDVDSAMLEAKRYQAKGLFGDLSPGAYAFLKKHKLPVL